MSGWISRGDIPVLRESDDSKFRILEGYAAKYDTWITEEWNGRTYREMDKAGLFDESLKSNPRVSLKYGHGDSFAATWNDTLHLRSDDVGLHFTARVNTEDPLTKSLVVRMEDGLLREASVGYFIHAPKEDTDLSRHDNGADLVVLKGDLDKGDVSVCLFGQNSEAWSTIKRALSHPFGRAVLRSLGHSLEVVESVEREADVQELHEELVDVTSNSDDGDDLWRLHARLRLVSLNR